MQIAEQAPEPEMSEVDMFLVRCWGDVGTCRQLGMAVGPIPWTAVAQWCAHYELDRDATQVVIGVVQYLDGRRAEREAAQRELANMRGGKKGR